MKSVRPAIKLTDNHAQLPDMNFRLANRFQRAARLDVQKYQNILIGRHGTPFFRTVSKRKKIRLNGKGQTRNL